MPQTNAGAVQDINIVPVVDQLPTIISTPNPSFTEGVADTYDMSQHFTDDGVSTVTSLITNVLPNGLSYNGNTHVLSYDGIGSASVSGHQLRVEDAVGAVLSSSFNISIAGTGALSAPGVTGIIADGQTITISALPAENFGTKPNDPKPLFWWTADGGDNPSSLGRKTTWDDPPTSFDERQQVIVAPGSSWSYRADLGDKSSSAALGEVTFTPANEFYIWRKKYDDFDVTIDYAIRTRINAISGSDPVAGQTITGTTSGGSATVELFLPGVATEDSIYYTDEPTPVDFEYLEELTWPGGSGTNAEVAGTLRNFNYKTIRIWPDPQQPNGASLVISAQWNQPEYKWFIENISGIGVATGITQTEGVWEIEEYIFVENSAIDVADGEWSFGSAGVWYVRKNEVTRNTAKFEEHDDIFMAQNSNGGAANSYIYYDSLFVEDSRCRVFISSLPAKTGADDVEIQIPTAWASGAVSVVVRQGSLATPSGKYINVVDQNDVLITSRLIS